MAIDVVFPSVVLTPELAAVSCKVLVSSSRCARMLGETHLGHSDWASSHHRGQRENGGECERELHYYEEGIFSVGLKRMSVCC